MNTFLRALFITIAVVAIGVVGYLLAPRTYEETPVRELDDLYTLLVIGSEFSEPEVMVEQPDSLSRFIYRKFHRQVRVPELKGLRLEGLSTLALPGDSEVPVLIYRDTLGVYTRMPVLNYTVLDRLADKVIVDSTLFKELEQERKVVVRKIRAYYLGIWRERDDIYVLITLQDPRTLLARSSQEPNR